MLEDAVRLLLPKEKKVMPDCKTLASYKLQQAFLGKMLKFLLSKKLQTRFLKSTQVA